MRICITTLDSACFPAAPEGWRYTNLVTPDKLDDNLKCYPVLLFGCYTYTAVSDLDNNYRMKIIGWDKDKKFVKELIRTGARYIWEIALNERTQTVIFIGQARKSIHVPLRELVVRVPWITTLDQSTFPPAPGGWAYTNLVDPDKSDHDSKHYPVLFLDGITYTAVSDMQNSVSMKIVGWNADKTFVKQLIKPGARYIWEIAFNELTETVDFIGQNRKSVHVTLDELTATQPFVTTLDQGEFPDAPSGWKYTNINGPDVLEGNSRHYPVFLYGGYRYTALSDINNMDSMMIAGWDENGNIVKQIVKPGARYIWEIIFSPLEGKVTWFGQASKSVETTLAELIVQ